MESTGVYWIPLYARLEACGMTGCLVNAQATKNGSGRKTDVLACQWIQQLHRDGFLAASFRPPAAICVLRSSVRQRERLLQDRARQIQPRQKALHLMNLKLTLVLTDLTGLTGMLKSAPTSANGKPRNTLPPGLTTGHFLSKQESR